MRAAYIAAMNGRQVAVLAPTTVLAEQHYESFISRFDNTPVTITSLSRLHTGSARSRTLEQIACGSADIVVGTHAILSRQVRWRNLGLIIIDEEQRFGVKDKEHLKRLRENADILMLSATPIPRTLYMSMTGMRDLSLLKTPPRERVAVETHIVADSDETVRAAVEREIARLKTGWMKGELDKNRDATVRSVMDMQRETRTRWEAAQPDKRSEEDDGRREDGNPAK
jgi:transcription-repair coupling factor (superfamily II helicase)